MTIVGYYTGICLQMLRKTIVTVVAVLTSIPNFLIGHLQNMGHMVAWLVEALCYKPEGRGFDSQRGHWIFQLT
jgi:ABC-type enterochelin transport system permease subunit